LSTATGKEAIRHDDKVHRLAVKSQTFYSLYHCACIHASYVDFLITAFLHADYSKFKMVRPAAKSQGFSNRVNKKFIICPLDRMF